MEFDPVTMEKVWGYSNQTDQRASGGDRRFFSWFISSVQRLPNGNTLITEGADGRVFEVTPVGEIVWEYYPAKCTSADPQPCIRDRPASCTAPTGTRRPICPWTGPARSRSGRRSRG